MLLLRNYCQKSLRVKFCNFTKFFLFFCLQVISSLQESLESNIYTADNVILSATHTHSGPAGYMQYVLFEVTSLGFIPQTFDALVDGITRVSVTQCGKLKKDSRQKRLKFQSILIAHNNMKPAILYYNEGEIHDANINRSPTSYLVNPPEEVAK